MRRREFITLLGSGTVAWPLAARAQQGERVRRIGFLGGAARPISLESSFYGGLLQACASLAMSRNGISSWSGDLQKDEMK
jgi:hypothetical protein